MNHASGNGRDDRDRDPPVELRCVRCRTDAAAADLTRARPTDDPLVTLECPDCGSVLDIGPHAW